MSIDAVLNAFTTQGSTPRSSGDGKWTACCPAHDDHKASLTITAKPNGMTLAHCHAGCPTAAVVESLGLTMRDLGNGEHTAKERPQEDLWTPRGDAVAAYDYTDEQGTLLYQVLRLPNKAGFMQRRPNDTKTAGWEWKLGDVRLVPYHLPRLLKAASDGRTIFIVEGEKDVHAIEAAGEAATCNSGGAGKWHEEFARHFEGAEVVIVADKDAPGYKHAKTIQVSLKDKAASIQMVESAVGKDAADHLASGKSLNDLVCTEAPEPSVDIHQFLAAGDASYDWLVPGLLERRDRLMLTGEEGLGKSMLQFQIATCLSAGIDPMWGEALITPCRVLMIDCENGERHIRRKMRPMFEMAVRLGHPIPRDRLYVCPRPSGLDLTGDEDASWLLERVLAIRPDVLVIGPLYRLHADNPNDEMPARGVTLALDTVRAAADCAIILEAHAGHGDSNGRYGKRPIRPTGSSLWLRWPEFGYGIEAMEEDDNGKPLASGERVSFRHWRGPRDDRNWPSQLHRAGSSGGWPWSGYWPKGHDEWAKRNQPDVEQPGGDF